MSMHISNLDSQTTDWREQFKTASEAMPEFDLFCWSKRIDQLTSYEGWQELIQIDQQRQWELGNRRLVEEYLFELGIDSDSFNIFAEVVLNEISLAVLTDEEVDADAYVARFPQLESLIQTHIALLRMAGKLSDASPDQDHPATGADDSERLPPGYKFTAVFGRGGMGKVLLAQQEKLSRRVAIKLMSVGLRSSRDRHRFNQEALTIARLQHPNIVQLFDVGEFEGAPYLVLEPVYGGSLRMWQNGKRVTAKLAVRIVSETAKAIQYAHDCGVLHRDLKPSNVLLQPLDIAKSQQVVPLSKDGQLESHETLCGTGDLPFCIKVTDFGLAKLTDPFGGGDDQAIQTKTGEILGTPAYMAPEQASGTHMSFSPSADVYGLGAILYELVTGQAPFEGSVIDVLHQIRNSEVKSARLVNPKIDRDLDTVLSTALAKQPSQRYATVQAFRDDLNRYLLGQSIVARPVTAIERLIRLVTLNPAFSALVVSLAMSIIATLLVLVISNISIRQSKYELQIALNDANNERERERIARHEAVSNAHLAQRRYYASQMQLASRAFHEKEYSRVQDCLNSVQPSRGEVDLRGIEWHFLNSSLRQNTVLEYWMRDSEVRSLSLSRDSRWIASGNNRGLIEVWNVGTMEKHTEIRVSREPETEAFVDVHAIAFHPFDEDVMAYRAEDGDVAITNVNDRRELFRTHSASVCRSIAWLNDGTAILLGYENGSIRRFEYPTLVELPMIDADTGLIHRLAVSTDNKFCVHASPWGPDGKHSKLWDITVEPWRQVATFPECYATSFTPDSQNVVCIVWEDIRLLPTDGTSPTNVVPKKPLAKGMLTNVVYSHDGRHLYSSSHEDRTAKQWDSTIENEIQSFAGTGNMNCLTLDRTGKCWAGGMSNGSVTVWKVGSTPVLPPVEWPEHVLSIGRADDDTSLFLCDRKSMSKVDMTNGKTLKTRPFPFVRCMSRSGTIAVATSSVSQSDEDSLNYQRQAQIRVVRGNSEGLDELDQSQSQLPVTYRAIDLTRDGRLMAVGFESGHTQLFQVETGELTRLGEWQNTHSMYLRFNDDGTELLSCGWDGRLSIVDTKTLSERLFENVFPGFSGALQCGSFSSDGKLVAVSNATGEVAVFSRESGHVTARLTGHTSQIRSLVFTKDSSRLLVGLSELVKVWNIDLEQELIDLPFPKLRPLDVLLLDNESVIAIRSDNGILFAKRLFQ